MYLRCFPYQISLRWRLVYCKMTKSIAFSRFVAQDINLSWQNARLVIFFAGSGKMQECAKTDLQLLTLPYFSTRYTFFLISSNRLTSFRSFTMLTSSHNRLKRTHIPRRPCCTFSGFLLWSSGCTGRR